MIKIKKGVVFCAAAMAFQLSASEQKFSLKQLDEWKRLIESTGNQGVIVLVHDSSCQDHLKQLDEKQSSLIELFRSNNTPGEDSQASLIYRSWVKQREYIEKQVRIRADNQLLNNEVQAYLNPVVQSFDLSDEIKHKILEAYAFGYLTFEVTE